MLKGIIEQYYFGVGPVVKQLWNGHDSLLTYRYRHVGKLLMKKHGFIANLQSSGPFISECIPCRLSFIPPAQHREPVFVF